MPFALFLHEGRRIYLPFRSQNMFYQYKFFIKNAKHFIYNICNFM